jgi:hypothetical protein
MELQLLLLALEAALYPTLLAAVVILLSQPRRRPLLTAYLAGGLTVSIGLGLLIIAALQQSKAVAGGSTSTTSWVTDIVVGGLALLVAVALATRTDERVQRRRRARHPDRHPDPDDEAKEPWTQRLLARGSVPIVFFAALAVNLPGAAYLVALKDIAAAHEPTATIVAQVVAFNAIMFLLAEIPLAGLYLAPEPTVALVHRVNEWFSRNGRTIAVVLCGSLGVFLVARGLIEG